MGELFKRFRGVILFFGLLIFALMTMHLDHQALKDRDRDLSWWSGLMLDITVPVQKMVTTPVDSIRSFWNHYIFLVATEEENDRLRSRIAELEDLNLQLQEALVAGERLERIVEMQGDLAMPMIPAEVVGQDASTWFRFVLIDKGREEQVSSGMPVVTDQGVAGLVVATSGSASKAMLLLDRQSAIDGVIQRSRIRGMIRGVGREYLELEFVPDQDSVRVGDLVITSGLGGVYPKGFRIGEVVEVVESSSSGLLQKAHVKPAVNFRRMEQVFVLQWRGPTMELLYEEKRKRASSK